MARELVKDLNSAGFAEIRGGGKGSHRMSTHDRYNGAVTLSDGDNDDARPNREEHVRQLIDEAQ